LPRPQEEATEPTLTEPVKIEAAASGARVFINRFHHLEMDEWINGFHHHLIPQKLMVYNGL